MLSRKRGAGRTPSWRGALSLDHATVQDGEGMEGEGERGAKDGWSRSDYRIL